MQVLPRVQLSHDNSQFAYLCWEEEEADQEQQPRGEGQLERQLSL